MKDKALRDEIAYEYRKWNPSASIGRALEFADFILSLIDVQRCVWTLTEEGLWKTQCGQEIPDEDTYEKYSFCPCCGKRIEVKDGQG
jgi:hypothetical protein